MFLFSRVIIYHNYAKQRAYIYIYIYIYRYARNLLQIGLHYVAQISARRNVNKKPADPRWLYNVTFPTVTNSGSLRE